MEYGKILRLVLEERQRQDVQWGEQNHDDITWSAILTEEVGEAAQAALHAQFGGDAAPWVAVEVIHTAAVCLVWLDCLERHGVDLERRMVRYRAWKDKERIHG